MLAISAIAGCAHAPNLALRRDTAPPAGSTIAVFTATDGTQRLARRPPTETPRGVHLAISGAGIEASLGPIQASGAAERARNFEGGERGPLSSDQLWTTLSLRVPGNRAYWPGASAGVGPYGAA